MVPLNPMWSGVISCSESVTIFTPWNARVLNRVAVSAWSRESRSRASARTTTNSPATASNNRDLMPARLSVAPEIPASVIAGHGPRLPVGVSRQARIWSGIHAGRCKSDE